MPIYTLDIDEAVILQASRVSTGTFGTADLILTNKNLIQVNKGILGGDKDCIKYPLANLKVLKEMRSFKYFGRLKISELSWLSPRVRCLQ